MDKYLTQVKAWAATIDPWLAAAGIAVFALAVIVFMLGGWMLSPVFHRLGRARTMRKEEEARQRALWSVGLRALAEEYVQTGKLRRASADEWLRRFARLQIPDLVPAFDAEYIKGAIVRRMLSLKKARALPIPGDDKKIVERKPKAKASLIKQPA